MSSRSLLGIATGGALFAIGVFPRFRHDYLCSPYANELSRYPELASQASPYGKVACDDFSVTAMNEALPDLLMVTLCIVGAVVLIRVALVRSVKLATAIGAIGASLGAVGGFLYSGISVTKLFLDREFYFAILVALVIASIVAAVETRRLPNTSLERTRER